MKNKGLQLKFTPPSSAKAIKTQFKGRSAPDVTMAAEEIHLPQPNTPTKVDPKLGHKNSSIQKGKVSVSRNMLPIGNTNATIRK